VELLFLAPTPRILWVSLVPRNPENKNFLSFVVKKVRQLFLWFGYSREIELLDC